MNRSTLVLLSWVMVLPAVPSVARAAGPSADEILSHADAILAPDEYEAKVRFVSHRSDATKTFEMHLVKKGTERLRVKFLAPAEDRDTEVLRVGENMWNYLPNLKRALRISPKQEFHGGDFSNSDVLRVNLAADYAPKLLPESTATEWVLELVAKNDHVAYAKIKYWISKKGFMPLRQEFFTDSGKLVRKLEMSQPKAFGKLVRPTVFVMKNLLVPTRYSEMIWDSFAQKRSDDSQFLQASLGR
jgi:outer membrane lipoprotein-sorting protein